MKRPAVLMLILLLPAMTARAQTTTATSTTATSAPAAAPGTTAPAAAPAPVDPTKPDLSIPADTAKQWVVGFTVFDAKGLAPENAYLAFSIPLLLKDAVSGLETHTIADDERDFDRGAIIARGLLTTSQSVTAAHKDRDALLFGGVPVDPAALKPIDLRIAALEVRRVFLSALDPSKVSIAPEKPILFKEGSGPGKLLELPVIPSAAYCAREGLDLLIGGSIRQVEGYLLVDTWAYDAARGRVTTSTREAAQRDELYVTVPLWGKDLIATILGRSWSVIAFTPEPPDASLYVDGSLTASGVSPALYLVPGIRELTISASGYRDITRSLTLLPGEETPLAISLLKEGAGSIFVSSMPAGADLYVNSLWQGRTPLLMDRPTEWSRGVLTLSGFYDMPFSLGADSPPQITLTLQPDLGAREIAQKKARDEFYTSFAWFAASVPLPLFSNAFALDYALLRNDALAQGQASQAASAQMGAQVFLAGYYVGLAISASLFTWMVFRIIHYISVSNGTAG
ncbi:MAG: hypothetical protein ABSG63_16280 [Spirochaetia bacterium]|jgi:hypothetical protein